MQIFTEEDREKTAIYIWPSIRFILKNVSCAFEKSVYATIAGYSVPKMSVRCTLRIVLFESFISVEIKLFCFISVVLIFCLVVLSNIENGVLKSLTLIVLSTSPLNCVSFAACIFGVCCYVQVCL